MSTIEAVIAKLLRLSPEQREQVLEYVERLPPPTEPEASGRTLFGLWAGLTTNITEEDIREARREMWGSYVSQNEERP